jgi:nucleotide-binding universal stress UspA family protein
MPFSFKTIVVPVDFSINSEVAINKALEVADTQFASLHLMHVTDKENGRTEKFKMLKQWKDSIEETTSSIRVFTWMLRGASVPDSVAEKAKKVEADLIVVGKNSNHTWFPFLNTIVPSDLAEISGIAVLTVKPGSLHNKIKTVVVPVTDHLTGNKKEIIGALCRKQTVKVHLVTFVNGNQVPEGFSASSFLEVYQWLKSSFHCSVEFTVLHGTNKAKSILAYVEKIHADVLLVHPKTETKVGWLNTHISDMLSPQSKVQVLTVQPIQSS